MFVRTVLWDLTDSAAMIEELRAYLAAESAEAFSGVEGLRLKLWIADEGSNRWGAIYLWENRTAARVPLPSKARELIGKEPDEIREFDLEASVEGIYETEELARRGLAF